MLWKELYSDMSNLSVFEKRPKLAHYTSLANVERILKNREVWLSNPLLMNDHEEIRYGINNGIMEIMNCEELRSAFRTQSRWRSFRINLENYVNEYDRKYLFDNYIMCFSEHDRNDTDGSLSMWRAYGGDGKGAALIFDTQSLLAPNYDSPLTLGDVDYLSDEDRRLWLKNLGGRAAKIIKGARIKESDLHIPAYYLLERLKTFSIFTKHIGFKEEREWRIVYRGEEDKDQKFSRMLSYHHGDRGIEPKLKLSAKIIEEIMPGEGTFDGMLDSIIIGPSISSQIALKTIERMVKTLGYSNLLSKVHVSNIPYRPL